MEMCSWVKSLPHLSVTRGPRCRSLLYPIILQHTPSDTDAGKPEFSPSPSGPQPSHLLSETRGLISFVLVFIHRVLVEHLQTWHDGAEADRAHVVPALERLTISVLGTLPVQGALMGSRDSHDEHRCNDTMR